MQLLDWLLDATPFTPRDACGAGWTPGLAVAAQLQAGLIAIAYFAIPILLWRLYALRRQSGRDDFRANWLCIAFAGFILACGVGHVWDVVVFHHPSYRLFVAWGWLTAAMSVLTAVAFGFSLKTVVTLPSLDQYANALATAEAERQKMVTMIAQLQQEVRRTERMESERGESRWLTSRHEMLDRLLVTATSPLPGSDTRGNSNRPPGG